MVVVIVEFKLDINVQIMYVHHYVVMVKLMIKNNVMMVIHY